jgi:multicomponent Na+:H+ antiporter subunit A
VGAMVAFIFVIYSAPDLALTQLLIEVISTVFFMLVFAVLPAAFEKLSPRRTHIRDGAIAVVMGLTMAGVAYAAASSTALAPIANTLKAESLSEGFGANVVNVILVDFRGFDTLGEITVLMAALLGIYAMLRLRPISDPTPMSPRGERMPSEHGSAAVEEPGERELVGRER